MNKNEIALASFTKYCEERSKYHATFGNLIDKLKNADNTLSLSPQIKGLGAYRGYYSDIALCTESGTKACKTGDAWDIEIKDWEKWYKENEVEVDFTGTPKELAEKMEALLGKYFDGYKGGYNQITRDTPLWLATDYSDCSDKAVIEITDDLRIITKETD